MGQSPWFLLQWSQAEGHSLVSLPAGRHREHQWYPDCHKDRPSFPVPLGPGLLVQRQACLRGLASPSVSCPHTDGMLVSLPLCLLSLKQGFPAQGPGTGLCRKAHFQDRASWVSGTRKAHCGCCCGTAGVTVPRAVSADAGFQGEAWLSVLKQEA